VFYQKGNRFIYFAAALPDGPIKTLAGLRGKKIGVASLGSAAVPVINSSLRASGVDPKSVSYIPVSTGNAAMLALRSGQVDALGLWDSAYASYESIGQPLRYLEDPQISDYGNGAFFASDKTFTEKRKELVGFSRAINKASVFILESPAAAVKLYWKSNPGSKAAADEAEALAKAANELKFLSRSYDITGADKRYGAVDVKKAQQYIDLMKTEGLITQTIDAGAMFTTALVDESNKFDAEKVKASARGMK
jgi:NitT/TauT family transport system substrate-binding protein